MWSRCKILTNGRSHYFHFHPFFYAEVKESRILLFQFVLKFGRNFCKTVLLRSSSAAAAHKYWPKHDCFFKSFQTVLSVYRFNEKLLLCHLFLLLKFKYFCPQYLKHTSSYFLSNIFYCVQLLLLIYKNHTAITTLVKDEG